MPALLAPARQSALDHVLPPPAGLASGVMATEAPIDGMPIRWLGEPSPEVVQARLEAEADDARHEEIVRPRIAGVLTACKLVAADLEALHRRYADATDLDLVGYSRASAIWLLSGRQLGLHRALVVQVEAGICNEAIITGRAIHELSRVLEAFCVPDEERAVRVWLDDEGRHGYVKQGQARTAAERYENQLAQAMEAAGVPRIEGSRALTEQLYDHMSRVAHSRRSSCLDSVSVPGRVMAYGVHPSPIRRAEYAHWAASMTVEVVNTVGDALRALYSQPEFFTQRITPLIRSVEAGLATNPLDEDAIRAAAVRQG